MGTAIMLPLFALLLAQHGSSTKVNPYTKPDDVTNGAAIYRARCAGCHGLRESAQVRDPP